MVLYVSKRFDTNIAAQAHLKAIREIVGAQNVYTVDLRLIPAHSEENYVAFGKYKSRIALLGQLMQGNSSFISNQTIRKICDIVRDKKIDTVFIEDSMFGNLAEQLKKQFPQIKIITFFHDIGVDLYNQWKKNRSLIGKIECNILIKQEALQIKYSNVNLVFNNRDAALCRKHFGWEPDHIIPLSWDAPVHDADYLASSAEVHEKVRYLFVGSKYWPNILGIRWFYANVLPKLGANVEVVVVGRGTEILKDELSDPRMSVIGGVDDLGAYYRSADLVILPLFDGGGMKTKTVEALAFGKTIVGTKEGFEGYWEHLSDDIKGKYVFRSDDADEWVSALNTLSAQPISPFNEVVYREFLSDFSYQAMLKQFRKVFANAGQDGQASNTETADL